MEQANQKLLNRVETLSDQNQKLSEQFKTIRRPAPAGSGPANDPAEDAAADSVGGKGTGSSPDARAGIGAEGNSPRAFDSVGGRGAQEVKKTRAKVSFAEGLEFASDDGEFKLQFHDLTQAELRMFPQQNQGLLHTSFFIPRQRWYFTGRVTKNIEYYTAINRGYGSLDLLDAFLIFRYDERLRFRVGRMKTPYLYEYFQIAEGDLVAPERSLYAGNLAPNRQMGAMVLGDVLQKRATYALGAFNGGRRSFEDTNGAKDVFFFLDTRPWLNAASGPGGRDAEGTGGRTRPNQAAGGADSEKDEGGPLKYLNLGGSFNAGYENGPTQPNAFRTANDQSASNAAVALSPTFLTFNSNVVERGERMQWAGHVAWFYKSLFFLAEYGGGFGGYGINNGHSSTRLPFEGYTVQASYFLTGERITRRVNVVKPLRDFRFRDGKFSGSGAVEVYARYSDLNIGRNVFSSGLADPNNWSNSANATDIGLNWYLNFYTKIYLDWQHANFGQPVTRGNSQFMKASDLFWLRFQIFF